MKIQTNICEGESKNASRHCYSFKPTFITPNIQATLDSNGTTFFVKNILREAMKRDCVDSVHDAKLVYDLLKERMQKILANS